MPGKNLPSTAAISSCVKQLLLLVADSIKSTNYFTTQNNSMQYHSGLTSFLLVFFTILSLKTQAQQNNMVFERAETKYQEWYDNEELEWSQIADSLSLLLESISEDRYPRAYAYVVHKSGVIQRRMGRTRNAADFYQRALDIRLGLDDPDLLFDIANGYRNIGLIYKGEGELYRALNLLQEGLNALNKQAPQDTLVFIRTNLQREKARIYYEIGDLDNTLLTYRALIEYIELAPDEKRQEVAAFSVMAYQELATILNEKLERYEEAGELLAKAERIFESVPSVRYDLEGYLLQNRSLLAKNIGNLKEAEKFAKEAVDFFADSPAAMAENYNNLGIIYRRMGNLEEAEKALLSAGKYRDKDGDLGEYIFENRGDIAFDRGNYSESIILYKKAIDLLLPDGLENADLAKGDVADKEGLLISLTSLGRALKHNGDLREALYIYTFAATLIDRLRSDFRPDASKGLLAKRAKPIYAAAIEVCWELYQQDRLLKYAEKAIEFSERSRGLILHDAVGHVHASKALPKELAEKEKRLSLRLNLAEKKMILLLNADGKSRSTPEVAEARKQIIELRDQRKRLEGEIKAKNPEFAEYRKVDTEFSFAKLQESFLDEQTYLEYFVGPTGIFAFVANGKNSLHFRKLPEVAMDLGPRGEGLSAAIDSVRKFISVKDNRFAKPAHQLYLSLIEPIRDLIVNKELVIVRDGPTAYLSFDMLPKSLQEDGGVFSLAEYFGSCFIHDFNISYQHSLTLDKIGRGSEENNVNTFLGVSPVFDDRVVVGHDTFSPLDNQKLVKKLKKDYGNNSTVDSLMSVAEFLEQAGNYRIVQVESHALANDVNGDLSFIVFITDSSTEVFYVKDAYGLRMPHTEMVIINVCQGASGELREGEGVVGLSRAFFYAGARTVISALWEADDDVTTKISANFHERLQVGDTKNAALKAARLQFVQDATAMESRFYHPYYWAALLPIGNMDAMENLGSGSNGLGLVPWWLEYVIGGALLTLLFIYGKEKLKKKND